MSDTGAELGRGKGAAAADPRGNTRQVDGAGPGQPPPPATLAEALIRLQATLPRITRDDTAQVGTRTYKYANLHTITDAVMPLLTEHGLLWRTKPTMSYDRFVLAYSMTHVPSGELDHGEYLLPDGVTPQAMGGAITYARRYALCAYLGIAPADDDDDAADADRQVRKDYAERVAAGRMSREQMREHGQLERDVKSSPRRAERISGPAPDDDQWASSTPEDIPEGILPGQVDAMRILFNKLRITTHDDRMLAIASMLGIDAPESSKALSYNQGADMLRKLQKMISEEGKP